jgi:hypothetical protein
MASFSLTGKIGAPPRRAAILQFTATSIRRIEGDKFVSENDVFNPIHWIEDIVFPNFNFFEIGN